MGRIVFSTHAFMDENSSGTGDFVNSYQEEYGISPENSFSALGYDAVRLLSEAIIRSDSTDPQAIVQALKNTSGFKGVTGEISYLEHGRMPDKDVTMIMLHDEEIEAWEIIRPSSMSLDGADSLLKTRR